jgi:hypothetical protein
MPEELISIDGLEECFADLDRVPPMVATVGIVRGLHAAASVIQRAIRQGTPQRINRVGGDAADVELVDDLQTRVTVDSNGRGGSAEIGFWKKGYLAEWIEFGHRIVTHAPGRKNKPGSQYVGDVPADPFIRTAADTSAEKAMDAYVAAVNESLQQFSEEDAA